MNVYLAYTASGEWEDYTETVMGVFSSLGKAKQWFIDNDYTENEKTDWQNRPSFSYTYEDYGEEPNRKDFDNDEDYQAEYDYWKEAIENKTPYWAKDYWSWINTMEVQ